MPAGAFYAAQDADSGGVDPAVASGPHITTINDLVAVVVYYGLAMIVLIEMFHLG